MDINIYDILNEYEKEQVCEIVAEATSRAYGTDKLNDLDFDITGTILEDVDQWLQTNKKMSLQSLVKMTTAATYHILHYVTTTCYT